MPLYILDVKHLNPMLDLFLELCYTIIVPRERGKRLASKNSSRALHIPKGTEK